VGPSSTLGSLDTAEIFKPALLRGEIQCITASTPSDYRKSLEASPWIENCFRTVNVLPFDKEKTNLVLQSRKEQFEKFHGVAYTDEALEVAAYCSIRYFPGSPHPAKAMEVLDAAGSRVKLRHKALPEEVVEVQKRIKFIVNRMERANADREFEKARFYSDEERKERENLRIVSAKYNLDESSVGVVGREAIADVVSRWVGVPITSVREELSAEKHAVASATAAGTQKIPSLRVFLCHSNNDKPLVRDLYKRLKENDIDPWLDEENLLPGQDFDFEITKAVRSSHVVITCLSAQSVNKSGYLQKEIRKVLDVANEQPEGTIYIVPLRLEECEVPSQLRRWQWVDFFETKGIETKGFERLMRALRERARAAGLPLQ